MGIYTSGIRYREVPDYAAMIPANEAYDAAFGCAHILADCQANDMALFESSIYSDMNEVMALQEGYQVVNENAFTDVLKKIGEMFKKLIAKIKGIFNAFIAKLGGFAKNGKDLVKKYEKQILKYSNWKDFKVSKIRKPKKTNDIKASIMSVFKVSKENGYETSAGDRYTLNMHEESKDTADKMYTPFTGNGSLDSCQKIKDADTDDIKNTILKTYVDGGVTVSEMKEFSTEITEYLYDDEDTFDGDDDKVSSSTFTSAWVKGVLVDDDKWIDAAEKMNKNLDKWINGIIDDINKSHDKLADVMKTGQPTYVQRGSTAHKFGNDANVGKSYSRTKSVIDFKASELTAKSGATDIDAADKDANKQYIPGDAEGKWKEAEQNGADTAEVQKAIQAMQRVASCEQEVVTKVTSEYMAQVKFAIAQAKKLWTSAAAWSSTEHKEAYEYYDALGECAAEQVYQNFEAIRG
jgi:hypothetical protein